MFRQRDSQVFYLIVSSSDGINWVLPKGHIDPGETPEIATLRELAEEAGVVGEIVAPLSIRQFRKGVKELHVQYFLVRETGAIESTEDRTIRWEAEAEAPRLLTFPEARAALLEGVALVNRLN